MYRRWVMLALAVASLGVATSACSDDDAMTGPGFGDLTFTPSFSNIDTDRTVELVVSNASTVALGPILVGKDAIFPTTDTNDLRCDDPDGGIELTVTPPSIASLAPGADQTVEITIITEDVDLAKCPAGQYDADIFAAVDGLLLGGATVRFDWTP